MQYDPDFVPFPFQASGCKQLIRLNGRAILGDEMGLGKTIQIAMYIDYLQEFPIIVCCPASVKAGWEHELYKITGLRAVIAEGTRPPHNFVERNKDSVIIINYDILHKWTAVIKRLRPQLIVFDECQALTNRATLRSKAAKKISARVPHIIGSSGTPLVNRPAELWVILNLIWPKQFKSFVTFGQRYCGAKYTNWGWEYKGATNIPELHALLKDLGMIRRLKKHVLHELPKKQRELHFVNLEDRAEYEEAETNFIGWLKKQSPHKAKKAAKAATLVRLGALRMLCAKKKVRSVVAWINDWLATHDEHEKLVVFAWHKKMLDVLEKRINSRLVRVDGGTPVKLRRIAVEQFRKTKDTRVFIANLQAAGTGLDGLQIASALAIAEFPYRPGDLSQGEARIDRIGQLNTSRIYYLTTEATVEEDLCCLLQKKQEVASATLDGTKAGNDFELMDLLLAQIAQRTKNAVRRTARKTRSSARKSKHPSSC